MSGLEVLENLQVEDVVMRDKGDTQAKIPMGKTGKEIDRHRSGNLKLRTDMTDHPSHSSCPSLQTHAYVFAAMHGLSVSKENI